jgi:calpain-15
MAESVLDREQSRIGIGQLIEPKDIIQGSIGDCYFLSSISSIVWRYP